MPDRADDEAVVPRTYLDVGRRRRTVSAAVRRHILDLLGRPTDPDAVIVAPPGRSLPLPGRLELEDGTDLGRAERVPPDAPHGYHRLFGDDGRAHLLLTGPGRCHLPAGLREWGWAIQLAATRSGGSWGVGDLEDLRALARWSAEAGAGFVLTGPLNAPNPGPDPDPSPYFPSTRRWLNPIHLRPESVPGAGPMTDVRAAGRALNKLAVLDRRRALALKVEALRRAWSLGRFDAGAFETWRRAQGSALDGWAAYSVLAAEHGPDWRRWPEPMRSPAATAVRRVGRERANEVAFWAWVQWCADLQLRAASLPLRRIADMPVGVDPGGFDAWEWQDQLAGDASIGAPPDTFNTAGQDWSLPPFIPHRLRAEGYRPFIETVRSQLRHAGGLRIDHVLGLFRLWWVPSGADPSEGAYVRYPTDELLEIVAIESERAAAIIIGEDLGTVPVGVRAELRRRRILSTRLALFERRPPSRYPRLALAAVTTHDLPTIAGLLDGADARDQAAAGLVPDARGAALLRGRLLRTAGLDADAPADAVALALHRRLAASPAMLAAATLEDALGVESRPNLPGTTASQRHNWSLALPISIEGLEADSRVRATVGAFGSRSSTPPG